MAKKRKAPNRSSAAEPSNGFDPKGGKMEPITTFADVADSEDEFHINRDKILLDDGPDVKRRKKWQDEAALLEPSDDEVLAYSSESEDDDNEIEGTQRTPTSARMPDKEGLEDEDEDAGGWGSSKKDYYNNDQAQTEADALEEEAEAKRLQQKKLQKMTRADFGLDEFDWDEQQAAEDEDEDGGVIRERLEDIQITPLMGAHERMGILRKRYPEFEYLADEFIQLTPEFEKIKQQFVTTESTLRASANKALPVIQYRALGAYLAGLGMYFALLTSPSRDEGEERALHPEDLHNHPIMETLRICRELWTKVRDYQIKIPTEKDLDIESMEMAPVAINGSDEDIQEIRPSKKSKKERVHFEAAKAAATLRAQKIEAAEEDLADLSSLIPKSGKPTKKAKKIIVQDSESDFGEEESMDAKAAAEKARKKKSLQFYTSQIAQKANKRADAGRDAGGDEDLPHRERLRDRQARLNAEAEKRGKKLDEYGRGGVALGDESGSEDENVAEEVREEEDEYYDMVAKTSKSKKNAKIAKSEAIEKAKAEGGLVRVVEGEMDEEGKRAIGYVIEKNKGLAPKRKKDVRNPRVKKRKKYEEKKKKLASTRAVYKGGEERGGYGGEKTGIKSGLVKSIKL